MWNRVGRGALTSLSMLPSGLRRVALEALVCATQPVRRMRVHRLECSTAFTRPAPKWRHSEGTRAAHSDGKSVRAREEGEGGREGGSDEGEGRGERRPPSFVVACSLAPLEKAAIMKTDVHVTALHHRSGSDNGSRTDATEGRTEESQFGRNRQHGASFRPHLQ